MIVDLHTHTRFGSNCSYIYPWDLARRAKEIGLDALCITEHNICWSEDDLQALSQEYDIPVFGGVEMDTDAGEFLVFGVSQVSWADSSAEKLRALVDSCGGVMIASHPFRGEKDSSSARIEDVCRRVVFKLADAVEVFNGVASRRETDFGCEVLKRLNLRGVGGSDTHALHTVGRCVTVFEKRIRNQQELIVELKAGRFKALHQGMKRLL